METKREKTKEVLKHAIKWADLYDKSDDEAFEEQYSDACEELFKAVETLNGHTTASKRPYVSKEWPEADYYDVTIGDNASRRARCKRCGYEMNPSGFKRHYEGPACDARLAKLQKGGKNNGK